MPWKIVRNEINKQKADIIVNPVRGELLDCHGVTGKLYDAVGEDLLREALRDFEDVRPGKVLVTPAFSLSAQYIFHVVVPSWHDGTDSEELVLYRAYQKALLIALRKKCKSIAFPLLVSKHLSFPGNRELQIAKQAIIDFLEAQSKALTVYLVVQEGEHLLKPNEFYDVRRYIEEHYEIECFQKPNIVGARYLQRVHDLDCQFVLPQDLKQALANVEESFSQKLLHLIDAKGLTDVDAYKKANVSRMVFSKIRKDDDYVPKKSTALAFIMALHLSLQEAEELLASAGFVLSKSSKTDLIIRYCLENNKYDEVNEYLVENDLPMLNV